MALENLHCIKVFGLRFQSSRIFNQSLLIMASDWLGETDMENEKKEDCYCETTAVDI